MGNTLEEPFKTSVVGRMEANTWKYKLHLLTKQEWSYNECLNVCLSFSQSIFLKGIFTDTCHLSCEYTVFCFGLASENQI